MKAVIFRAENPLVGEVVELSMIRILTFEQNRAIYEGTRWKGIMFEITQPDSIPSICLKKVDNLQGQGIRIEPIRQSVLEIR